jgi:transposase
MFADARARPGTPRDTALGNDHRGAPEARGLAPGRAVRTHVAMEATGVYWKPVWHMLEGAFELLLANPAHIRNVPGRKSDVNDATWIADLLAHGLIRASLVPPGPIQELRDLTRTRKQLTREIAQHKQRIQKVLEDANVKLASVVSDVFGESGRRMLKALSAGQTDASQLAALRDGRLSASRETSRPTRPSGWSNSLRLTPESISATLRPTPPGSTR